MTLYSKNLAGTKQILDIAIAQQDKENDSNFLVTGAEGTGKSVFTLNCLNHIEERLQLELSIDVVCRNLKEFIKQLRHTGHRGIITLDEGEELSSDNQHDSLVKAVKKIFTVMRFKKIISFICFRNPLKIHTYFREDRCKGVFIILRRGEVRYFSRTRFVQVLEDIRKKYGGIKSIRQFQKFEPTMIDTFPKYEGHLLDEYRKRKEEGANADIEELYEEFGIEEKLYSQQQACRFLGISDEQLRKYIIRDENNITDEQVIPAKWNLAHTKMKIKEDDLLNFKIWYEERRKKLEMGMTTDTLSKKEKIVASEKKVLQEM